MNKNEWLTFFFPVLTLTSTILIIMQREHLLLFSNSIFLFWDSTRVALLDLQFKKKIIYLLDPQMSLDLL